VYAHSKNIGKLNDFWEQEMTSIA